MKYADPIAAAKHYRSHRALFMQEARRTRTRNGKRKAVACARVMNVSLVAALQQSRAR